MRMSESQVSKFVLQIPVSSDDLQHFRFYKHLQITPLIMDMYIQQDDYQQSMENLDLSLDDQDSRLLEKISEDSLENLLSNYKSLLTDREKSEAIKKQISKVSADAKEAFYRGLWNKILTAVNQIMEGKMQFQVLKESSIIELILTAEGRMVSLFEEMYKNLHKVFEKETNHKNFAYLLKILHKIAKPLDKREQLATEMFELHKSIKQQAKNQNATFAIANKYQNCSTEEQAQEKVYLQLLLVHFLSSNENQQLRIAEEELRKLGELVKEKPYITVLDFIIKYGSKSKKISRDIVGCDFKVENGQAKYVYNQTFLHRNLETKETYLKALQTASEKVFQQLRKENFILHNDKLYCKINVETLQKISEQSKLDVGEYSNEMLTQLADLMKYLLSNSSKRVANSSSPSVQMMKEQSAENQPQSTETVDQYLMYVWIIFSKFFYEHERNELDQTVLFDKINVGFINDMLRKALQLLDKVPGKEVDLFVEEVAKVVIHLLYKNEYAAQANYASETSKLLEQMLLRMRQFPIKWRNLKKIKAMLDKWGETISAEIPANISSLIGKFIDAYFDQRLYLKSRNFSHFEVFANQQYTRALGTLVSTKLISLLQSCIASLSKFPLSSASAAYSTQLARTNGILYKMGCLYISRMKIPDNEGIADLVFRLYQNWAPQLSFIYSLRTWILNYSNKLKDGESLVVVNKMMEVTKAGFPQFESTCQKMTAESLLGKFDKENKENEALVEYLINLSILVNNVELKQRNDIYGSTLYASLIQLSQSLQFLVHSLNCRINKHLSTDSALFVSLVIKNELASTLSFYAWLSRLSNNLVAALRFLVCNLSRMLDSKDQIFLLENCAQLLRQFAQLDRINEQSVKFVNDLLGFNEGVGNVELEKGQSVGRLLSRHLHNNRDEFSFSKQDYTPLVVVSTLYSKLKSQYPAILKNSLAFLSQLAEEGSIQKRQYLCNSPTFFKRAPLSELQQKRLLSLQVETLISSVYLPSINIFMVAQNGAKNDEKDREEEAFGILYDQFTLLIKEKVSAKEITCLHSQLSGFFEVCSDKQKKVINKQISAPQRQHRRPLLNQAHRAEILNELGLMGFEPETVELAMEHVDENDPDAIINWLQTNSHRLNEILTNRAIERSRNESQFRKKSNKEESQQTLRLSYVQFVRKVNQDTKQIIKLLVPELFSEHGTKIKKLIFVCLDSFQEETYKNKQLLLFAEMVCKEMDKLNSNFNLNILLVAVSSLEVIITKRPDTIKQLHDKSAPYKLLSFMDKCNQEVGEKILSVINATLPTPTDKSSPVLKEYLNYIGDILLTTTVKSEHKSEILCKMVKAKDQAINEKVLRIICKGLSEGILREKLFSMITLVLDTDREFSMANIELEIKNFIIQNCDLSKKERFVKLDPKKFGTWFTRYEDHQYFQQTMCKVLAKKGGKLSYEHEKHNLYWSETLDSSYFSYKLPQAHKILMKNLVSQIVKEEKLEARVQYIRELHKILDFYKILLPYTIGLPVGDGLSFGEWILEKEFQRAKGKILGFVTFMFLKNGIYLKEGLSYSDYLAAKLISKYINQPELRSCPYLSLLLTYLLHLKSLNVKSHISLSRESASSLKATLEHNLHSPSKMHPVEFALSCQSLYLIYKKEMIDAICQAGKYKIDDEADSPNSNASIERQVLNMDLFYSRRRSARGGNSLANTEEDGLNAENFRGPNGRLNFQRLFMQLTSQQGRDEGDDSETLHVLRRMLMLRDRSSQIIRSTININSIFVPVQPPPQPQPPQQQQQQAESVPRIEQAVQQNEQIQAEQVQSSTQQKKEKEQNKEQKQMKMQEESKTSKIYLTQIIEAFESILLTSIETEPLKMEDQNYPRIPQSCLKETDLKSASFTSTLKEPRVSIDYKLVKSAIFRERIMNIAEQIVEPGSKWASEDQEANNPGPRRQNPFEARVTIERDGQSYGLRRHVMNRLMGSERERDRDQAVQPINVNRLLGQMPEHQDPKPPQIPKQVLKDQMVQVKQGASEPKKPEDNEMKQEKVEQKVGEQKQQSSKQQPEQKIEEEPQHPSQIKQQMIPVSHEEPVIIPPQQNQPNEQMVAENVQQAAQTMVQESTGPHRQILQMMGLPQTFLRDAGIDIESFDSLPEDMQIEQLTVLMDNQHIRSQSQQSRPGQAQQNQAEVDPNQVMNELQNQNAAFIASLDGALRQQTLMEATPEFLMTLPLAMRAEAENYRQRQISQMLHEQQIELEEERINRSKQPKTLVYPELSQQEFPEIPKPCPENISQALVLRFSASGYKPEFFRILLENKHTQKKSVNTVIYYLKNLEQVVITQCTFNKETKMWEKEETGLSGHSRKTFIEDLLAVIQDHLTNCLYKDNKFLEEKHDLENFTSLELKGNPELRADTTGYYPLFELIDLALDNHSYGLLNKLIKKATDLPKRLRKRIIRGIRDDKFNEQFYNSLQKLSNNQKFKSTFIKEFPEDKPIKIETLSKVLKYNFSKLPYLKELHVDTLKKIKGTPPKEIYDFLNQIFSSYTAEDIKELEPLLLEHKQTQYHIIKYLYESGRSLDTEPIGLILKFPHLLDFETKRFIFQQNPKLHKSRHRCVIEVSRLNLFQESFNQLMGKTVKELEGSIKVVFVDEQAEDAGGPKKQWFLSLSKQIFDPRYALFEPSSSGNTYQPNPKSYVNTEHFSYYKFIGRFIAKALCQGMLIDAFFTRSFYKMILGQQLEFKDLEEQDYSFYKSMIWLKENPLKGDEDYTFSYIYDYFGKILVKELMPGGESIKVTEENKADYIHKYTMAMMRDAIGSQIQKFLEGFYEILPKQSISFFEATELELLMSGMPSVNLKDLKLNTDYQGYSPNDQVIKWYWEILEEYTNEDLARLIQFITGTSKIPLEGFSKLQGMHGPQKISIHKDCHIDQLPKSHTCFNQLDLPDYPSKEMLKERLRVAITWGSEGFGFM